MSDHNRSPTRCKSLGAANSTLKSLAVGVCLTIGNNNKRTSGVGHCVLFVCGGFLSPRWNHYGASRRILQQGVVPISLLSTPPPRVLYTFSEIWDEFVNLNGVNFRMIPLHTIRRFSRTTTINKINYILIVTPNVFCRFLKTTIILNPQR